MKLVPVQPDPSPNVGVAEGLSQGREAEVTVLPGATSSCFVTVISRA